MYISFSKTLPQLMSGSKTVTRRAWCRSHHAAWCRAWDRGDVVHQAYDRLPYHGGKMIGYIKLAERPVRQRLCDMPQSDLAAEGGMCASIKDFIRFIQLPRQQKVSVIRFQFTKR